MSEENYTENTSEITNAGKTNEKAKVPAQFFQWFDSLRQGYENSINKLFNRVEKVNEDHKEQLKSVYQSQIDGLKKSYQDHLHSLKSGNQSQLDQAQARIKQLEKDAQFYQEQIRTQNQTIDKLNGRYDAVIFALKDKMDNKELENVIKDISPSDEEHQQPSLTDSLSASQQSDKTASDNVENSNVNQTSSQESTENTQTSSSTTPPDKETSQHKELSLIHI